MIPRRDFGAALRPYKPRRSWIGVLLVVAAFFASIVWFVFVSGYWRITQIEVLGMENPSEREGVIQTVYKTLDEGPWKPWDKRNIFFVHEQDLAKSVQEQLFAEHVTVEKSFPNILRLMIQERQRSVVLVSQDKQFLVDTKGIISGETDPSTRSFVQALLAHKTFPDISSVPVLVVNLAQEITIGYQASDADHVKRWITAHRELVSGHVRFRYMSIDTLESSLGRLKAEDGTSILIDLDMPLKPQIETYTKFIQHKQKNVLIQEYVDVRVPGKIFIK